VRGGGLGPARAHYRGQIVVDFGAELLDPVVEEVVRAFDDAVVDLDIALVGELLDQLVDGFLRDDVVHVSLLAGGETEMNPAISGRRISNCMPIQAPKENPAIQQALAFGL